MKLLTLRLLLVCWVYFFSRVAIAQPREPVIQSRPLVLVHYMPWFEARPARPVWGWHWTMSHFDPEKPVGGKRPIASHFYPLIGPYDSCGPIARYLVFKPAPTRRGWRIMSWRD